MNNNYSKSENKQIEQAIATSINILHATGKKFQICKQIFFTNNVTLMRLETKLFA